MKTFEALLICILFLLISAAGAVFFEFHHFANAPADTQKTEQVISIASGQHFASITQQLHQAGLITDPFKLKLYARIKGYDRKIKAGEYVLSAAMPPEQMLLTLTTGKVRLHQLTIPEGYTVRQVAMRVATTGFMTLSMFLDIATDPAFTRQIGINADTVEGYLFPDTYFFPKGVTPEKMVTTMVNRFSSIFAPEWRARAQSIGFSVHETVTLASIIEKETGALAEMPVISSVFHNRLKKGMRLESDPTVIYGLQDFDGNLTKRDLKMPSPYNTYLIHGLPPGPIANPGARALNAAIYPASARFLFFVSRKDGTHQFSENIRSHNRAVRKYQLNKAGRRPQSQE